MTLVEAACARKHSREILHEKPYENDNPLRPRLAMEVDIRARWFKPTIAKFFYF